MSKNQQSFCEEQSTEIAVPQLLPCDASQSSLDSQCSSGYCSDSSIWDVSHHGSLNIAVHLKGSCKRLPKNPNKNDDDHVTKQQLLPVQMISPTVSDDKLANNNYENCFIKNGPSCYENALPLNLHKPPPLPPKPCKKTPYYENHKIAVSHAKMTSVRSNSFPLPGTSTSNDCTCRRTMSSSCQQSVLPAHLIENNSLSASVTAESSKHQLEKIAFQKCSVKIVENLDISAIFPHLNSHGLLTVKDRQTLLNKNTTEVEKVHHLLDVLPRKDAGFFEKFILCLCHSKNGTGHDDIVKALTTSFKEVKPGKQHT